MTLLVMMTPSLRETRTRQATVYIYNRLAGTNTLLPNNSDALTQKTESIHSDDALPSSSFAVFTSIPRLRLEESFPSIISTVNIMKGLEKSNDVDGIQSLSQVFSTCLQSIIRSMDSLPSEVRLDPAYEVAQYAVIFTGNLFTGQVHKLSSSRGSEQTEMLLMVLEMVELTVSSLRTLLETAEKLTKERKPLPALPIDIADEHVVQQPATLINTVSELMNTEDNTGATSSEPRDSDTSHTTDITAPLEKKQKKLSKRSIIRRIIGRRSISSKASLFSHETKSSVTLVAPTDAQPKPPEPKFVLRQSALYYLADPYCPAIDVEMPIPTGDTVAVSLDHNGSMRAASLTALVRMLTSKDSVLDPELTTTYFICFRFFTTPTLFLKELVTRFDEQPAVDLNPAQLRIWTRYAMGVRIRVGKIILMWLDLYWKSEMDHEVLEPLQKFALERLAQELPQGLAGHILQGLDVVNGDEPFCRRTRKAKDLEFVYHKSTAKALPPAPNFEFTLELDLDATAQLLKFDTPAGREEVARQLTVKFSDLFQQVDPEDAVVYWHYHGSQDPASNSDPRSEVGRMLQQIVQSECALCMWITYTVLQLSTLQDRCRLLEFWLDVATVSFHYLLHQRI
jgi:RasGEF N-terminal motif/RasGEF domain